MNIYPAIDIMGGKAVRLTRGDYGTREIFGEPESFAKEFIKSGAKFLHTVDLDGAKSGRTENYAVIKNLCDTGLNVQVGGGVRDMERVEKYIDAGVRRVIIGTAAINNFEFLKEALKEYGDKIAVGVDAKNNFAATDGWEKVSQINSFEFCERLRDAGVKTVVYTDISTDGMMKGTNLDNFRKLSKIDGLNIIASGGVTFYEEIKALKDMGAYGVILGKALYKNLLKLDKAIDIAEGK